MISTSKEDLARLQYSLSLLKTQSKLEYTGEYGAEITTFIPFVAWLKQECHLNGRRIVTYEGMRPYYFFLDNDEFEAKPGPRCWMSVHDRYWPSNSTFTATASPWHVYPDYRQHFLHSSVRFRRPVIYIQNKFSLEWGVGPINYIPLNGLHRFLELTADRFDVVYSRPHGRQTSVGYSRDDNIDCDYPDRPVINQFAHVMDFEEECSALGSDYNITKLEVLAQSHIFIATQGGGAHILACFGDSLLLIIDRHDENLRTQGREHPHAYQHGPYKYLAKNPPKLFIARDFSDFYMAASIIGRATQKGSSILLPGDSLAFLERLSL